MSPVARTVCLLVATIIFDLFSDIYASVINALEVPLVVRNNTGPIDLSCVYEIREDENGLIIKWYHELDLIYLWLPPMPPQDVGIINGLAEYPEENLRHPNSRSVIRLKVVTIEMGGEYTCAISTFQEEVVKKTKMVVYVPETDARIYTSFYNETHTNLTCVVNGAQPRPTLRFYVEGIEIQGDYENDGDADERESGSYVKGHAIVRDSLEPTVIDCEVSIPHTDYKRRERIVHYPTKYSSRKNSAVDLRPTVLCKVFIILLICKLLRRRGPYEIF